MIKNISKEVRVILPYNNSYKSNLILIQMINKLEFDISQEDYVSSATNLERKRTWPLVEDVSPQLLIEEINKVGLNLNPEYSLKKFKLPQFNEQESYVLINYNIEPMPPLIGYILQSEHKIKGKRNQIITLDNIHEEWGGNPEIIGGGWEEKNGIKGIIELSRNYNSFEIFDTMPEIFKTIERLYNRALKNIS